MYNNNNNSTLIAIFTALNFCGCQIILKMNGVLAEGNINVDSILVCFLSQLGWYILLI